MNNTPPFTKYQGRSLEDLRSSLRAVNRKIDNIRMDAARLVGILPLKPGRRFWVATEIDWTDTRLDSIRDKYFQLLDTAYELEHTLGKIEAETNNRCAQWKTYIKINRFLADNFKTFEEEELFFKKNNLVRGVMSLREKIAENPDYLDEVIL